MLWRVAGIVTAALLGSVAYAMFGSEVAYIVRALTRMAF